MHEILREVPSATVEEYLKVIHTLGGGEKAVRPTSIARAMDVSQPTVTVTLRRLEEAGWIAREGRGVLLTDAGRSHAASVLRRRELALTFLEGLLDLPEDEVAEEACVLEHALSTRTANALEAFLEEPGRHQHGTNDRYLWD